MHSPDLQRAAVTRCVVLHLGPIGCRALQSTTDAASPSFLVGFPRPCSSGARA
jgi:hypothetical protein